MITEEDKSMITFEVEGLDESIEKIDRLTSRQMSIIKKGLMSIGKELTAIMKYVAPLGVHKGGTLRRSIKVHFNDAEISSDIYSIANYADYVDKGTGIYGPKGMVILPRTKPFLQWKDAQGNVRRAKWVRGMRPRYFVKYAIDLYDEESAQSAMADAYIGYSDGVVTEDTGEET